MIMSIKEPQPAPSTHSTEDEVSRKLLCRQSLQKSARLGIFETSATTRQRRTHLEEPQPAPSTHSTEDGEIGQETTRWGWRRVGGLPRFQSWLGRGRFPGFSLGFPWNAAESLSQQGTGVTPLLFCRAKIRPTELNLEHKT